MTKEGRIKVIRLKTASGEEVASSLSSGSREVRLTPAPGWEAAEGRPTLVERGEDESHDRTAEASGRYAFEAEEDESHERTAEASGRYAVEAEKAEEIVDAEEVTRFWERSNRDHDKQKRIEKDESKESKKKLAHKESETKL